MAQISYGSITIVDTNDIQRFYVQYAKNNSSAAAPTTGWSQNRPTWQNGTYIWQRTVAKREGVALAASDYGNPVCITGEKGDTGQQGNTGNGISSIVTTYCNYGSGTPVENYSGWSSNVPEYDSTKPNYWVKTIINYTSGNPDVTIYKDLGITEAAEKANLAVTTAQTANANSVEAISIAGSKNKIYYSDGFPSGGTYINGDTLFKQSSAGTVMYVYDEDYTDATGGHWKQEQFEENAISDLAITNAKIANLNGDKIIANTIAGNKIVAHDITALELATDAIKSSNYVAGTAPFSNRGTFLDLSNGNIYSPNFGINNTNDNITDGAYIKGSIYAYNGTIGQSNTNYWYIGNYRGYDQQPSAYIKGNGTATIQLGSSSTWRLNTNRIHTAWNDDSNSGNAYRLHYPVFEDKYWDMGVHVPNSKTDKFLYIRSSDPNNAAISNSDTLENLSNDINDAIGMYWNYQFYVTSEGNLYAKNLYILDDNGGITQIAGTSAPYLLKAGGDISGNLTIGGTLKINDSILNKSGNAITLQTSLTSTTAATLTGNSTSPISIGVTGTLPTSNGGTGNTSYNTGGIVYVDNSSPKKLLSIAAGTSGYLLKSGGTGAPTWVDPGTLTVAAATKATQDGSGNVITGTYMPFDGGTFTGDVIFNNDIKAPSLNSGQVIYVVKGTQTATTASWTGEIPIDNLYDGLTIAYYLPRKSASNVTLSLTLADGTSTFAIPVFYGTTRLGDQYAAGTTVFLTYWSAGSIQIDGNATTADRWTLNEYNTNSNTIGEYIGTVIAGPNGMARYSLIMQVDNEHWESLVLTSSSATTKTKNSSGFLLTSPIYYQSGETYVEGAGAGRDYVWSTASVDSRYSLNVSNSWSLAGRSLYLVGSIVNNKFYLKNTTWWADELPNEADGYYYWYVGQMYSKYQFTLAPIHPIWYYEDGQLKQLFVQNLTNSQIINSLGYTPYNVTNPNGYTTNTGTVTQITAGSGLKIDNNTSGGNITNTGTINHINSVTAQNTQALYPIKIDAQGHISAYGVAITSLPASDVSAWAKADSKPSYSYSEILGTPSSLKNPNDLEIKVYNGSTTSSDISYDGSTSNQSVSVAGTNAITGITSTQDGKLQLTLADGTQPNPIQVKIIATTSDSAASADKLNLSSDVGSSIQPVYFDGNTGLPVAIGYTIQSNVPANAIFPKFEGIYNESTNKAATVSTVTDAINALDGGTIGTGGTGKTITSLSQTNGQVSATFANISITKSQISDFPSTLTPTAHTHGNILNTGTITSTAVTLGNGDNLLFADSSNSGKIERSSITIGTGTTKYLRQDGTWGTPKGTYSLPLAANGTRGGVQIGYTESGKKYAVKLDSEKMYVEVPWTNTTYDAATADPLMDGTAAVGTSVKYARQDHKHPSDTSRVPTSRKVNGHALSVDVTISKSDIELGNVENIALSTWAGSANLTTAKVGTLAAAATKGVVTTLDTSANLPTAGAVSTAISNALGNYVTLTTEQTISGRKTFQNLATTTFKDSTGSEYCNINYNQTLGALVFSFG